MVYTRDLKSLAFTGLRVRAPSPVQRKAPLPAWKRGFIVRKWAPSGWIALLLDCGANASAVGSYLTVSSLVL